MPPGPLHTLLTLRTHDEDDARVAWTEAEAAAQAAADLLLQTNRAVEAGRDEVRQLEDRVGVHRSGRFTVADAQRQHDDLADAEHRLASSVREAALHHTRLLAARAEALKRQEAWAHARAERRAVDQTLARHDDDERQRRERQREDEVGDLLAHRHTTGDSR